MNNEITSNRDQYQRAARVMPWGVSSNFRYWGDETPVITRARRRISGTRMDIA